MNILAHPAEAATRERLAQAQLPYADLDAEVLQDFFYCGPASEPDGIVGLQVFGEVALLRSLAVIPSRRNAGVGTALVLHVEQCARQRHIQTLYLLTTTAEQFFSHLGYVATSRESAPAEIRATSEFSQLCPSDSLLMTKPL